MRKAHAGIKDVARSAGVSVTTVSRVVNGHRYVRSELRQRVRKAIAELGYSSNFMARSLVRQKTNLIGVIVSNITLSFFSTIFSSIEETASANGYNILVSNIADDLRKELKYIEVFKEMRVAGIILMHEKITRSIVNVLRSVDVPVVFSSVRAAGMRYSSVNIDDEQAAYDATAYLLKLGHRRIGLIGGNMREISSGLKRHRGYQRALRDHGMPLDPKLIRIGDFRMATAYGLMGELLAEEGSPSAVFAVSDEMAVGAMNYCLDNAISVPSTVSVIGFDDTPIASSVRPALTTVHQPIVEIGRRSVQILLQTVEGGIAEPIKVLLPHALVERESCAPVHGRDS